MVKTKSERENVKIVQESLFTDYKTAREKTILRTWSRASEFYYQGSVKSGTTIFYGKKPYKIYVCAEDYAKLLKYFTKNVVDIGTSRTTPPRGSLGDWLQRNITKTAIASYVGPILIHEKYAYYNGLSQIRFK